MGTNLRKSTAPAYSTLHPVMDSEAQNRGLTAEPFVTLSLSKKCVPKLSSNGTLSQSPILLNDVNVQNRDTIPATHRVKSTQRNSDIISTPSKKRQRLPMADTVVTSPTPSNIIILKYKKTPIAQPNGLAGETDQSTRPETPTADHMDYLWIDGQSERRSSIASSTDNGTRSSGRMRKLTTKAQALAGTNFLPSLQKTPEVESRASPASIPEVLNEQTTSHTASPVQNSPIGYKLPVPTIDEIPIESVESSTTRSSNRERKPTVRAIEMESERALRKRPASPMTTDRATKVARKSPSSVVRPSKLRPKSAEAEVEAEAKPDTTAENHVSTANANDYPMVEEMTKTNESGRDGSQHSSAENATTGQNADFSQTVPPTDLVEIQHDKQEAGEESKPPALCDLSCLSPSSALLAFARVAANWSDSDDDSENGDSDNSLDIDLEVVGNDTGGTSRSLERVRDAYCQCASVTLNTKSTNGIETPEGQEKATSDNMTVSALADDRLARNGHRTANVQASQSATSEKLDAGIRKTKISSTKDRQTSRKDVSLKRQNSSFEQRMKADYLASQQKRAVVSQKSGHRKVLSPSRSVRTRASISSLKNSPPVSPRYDHIDHQTNSQASDLGQARNRIDKNIKIDSHSDIIEALISHQQHTPSECLPESVASKSERVKELSGKKTSKIGMRGGGKTSAGGSVRLSLLDQAEREKVKVTKQPQPPLPSQTSSIKLKFTTTTR